MENNSKQRKSQKIVAYQFFLSIFIILIHNYTASYYTYSENGIQNVFHYIISVIVPQITIIAVPSFFVISGYLFYRNYSIGKTRLVLKKTIKTLLIPYLIWNAVSYFFNVLSYYSPISRFQQFDSNPLSLANLLRGVFLYKYNVFWFIAALLIFRCLCIPIYVLLRKKARALCCLIILLCLTGYLNIREIYGSHFEMTSFLYYCLGAYLGIYHKDFGFRESSNLRRWLALLLFVILIVLEVMMLEMKAFEFMGGNILKVIFTIIKSYCMWVAFELLCIKKHTWYFELSFFIYATHYNIERVLTTICRLLFGKYFPLLISEISVYLVSTIMTISVIILIAKIWKRVSLKSFLVLTGGR